MHEKYAKIIDDCRENLQTVIAAGKTTQDAQPVILMAILETLTEIGSDLVEYNSKKYIVGV